MISVIIPTYNEEISIKKTIDNIHLSSIDNNYEIIVVDGGSADNTAKIAKNAGCKIIKTLPGRGGQLNAGGYTANGSILLFVHADTLLPSSFDSHIINSLSQVNYYGWGRFDVKLSGRRGVFRIIERLISLRSRLTGIATGDQAIFVTKNLFDELSGFKNIPLMEDVDFTTRLKSACPPICLSHKVITSSRRWEENGIAKTVLLMWLLRFLYFIGVSPLQLKKLYR